MYPKPSDGSGKKVFRIKYYQYPKKKKVVVVGGGPAGLEAARVCAERGHKVILFEASTQLGGQVILAGES